MRRSLTFLQHFSRSAHMRHGLWYLGSNVTAAFVPFLLLPFLTRMLEPAAYGTYSLFTLAIAAALPLVTWMFSSVIAREYGLRDGERFTAFFSVCLSVTIALAAFWIVTTHFFRHPLSHLVQLPASWVQCAILCAMAQGLSAMMQSLYAMRKQPIHYSYWRVGYALTMGIALYLGANLGHDWEALGMAQTIAAMFVIMAIAATVLHHRWLRPVAWDESAQRDAVLAIRYSTPLVIHILTAGFLLQSVDRLFVSHYLGLAEAGSYNVAQQISLTIALLITSLNQVWQPWITEQLREDGADARARVVRATYWGFAGLWGIGMLAIGCIWLLFPYLIGPEFHAARPILPILMAAGIVNGMYVLVSAPLFFYGNTVRIMCCNIGTALVALLLNLLLVPRFGMTGGAFATLGAMGFMFLSIWITCIRLHGFPWLRSPSQRPPRTTG